MNIREPWRTILITILTALLTLLGGQQVAKFAGYELQRVEQK